MFTSAGGSNCGGHSEWEHQGWSPLLSSPLSPYIKYPSCIWCSVVPCGVVWCGVCIVSTEQSAVVFKLSDLVRQSNTDMINGSSQLQRCPVYPASYHPQSVRLDWCSPPVSNIYLASLKVMLLLLLVVGGGGGGGGGGRGVGPPG